MEYYYKVVPGTELHQKLKAFTEKVDRVRSMARMLAQTFGGTDFCNARDAVAGGIAAVYFPHGTNPEPMAMWKAVGEKWQRFFYPKAKHKDALQQIAALPVIMPEEMNAIIGFQSGFGSTDHSLVYFISYALEDGKDGVLLIKIPGQVKYKPVAGMEEIKLSGYKALTVEPKKGKPDTA